MNRAFLDSETDLTDLTDSARLGVAELRLRLLSASSLSNRSTHE